MWIYIALLAFLVYYLTKRHFSYFKKKGFPYVQPSFPLGSINGVGTKEHISEFIKRNYDIFKNKSPAFGMFFLTRKTIIPTDPELVKEILVKNFESFHDHGFHPNEKSDPLSSHLFFTKGQQWKDLRAKLSPTFTSGRMKMMFPIVASKADRMIEYLKPSSAIEIKEVISSYATEAIASVAFGMETEVIGNPQNDFRKVARDVFELTVLQNIKNFIIMTSERTAKFLNLGFTTKEVTNFLTSAVRDTYEYREKNNVKRSDFFQLAMEIMKKDKDFKFKELAANCFLFLVAGFETSSSVSTFMVYELAINQDIQERLRDEINEVLERHKGEVTYDAIMEMKYFDMVFNETMRKWPLVDSQNRTCTRDFKIPNTDLIIEAGTLILIPSIGLHMDERFWDEPEKFDPERFNEENVKKIVPYSYIPFSEGPRFCIGMRYGQMQTKLGIVKILQKFKILPSIKSVIPLKLKPTAPMQAPDGGLWVKLEKI